MNLGSEDAARMRHNRAVKKLITRIGGFRPWSDKDFPKSEEDSKDNLESEEVKEQEEKRKEDGADEY
jgi:hypothetical protein